MQPETAIVHHPEDRGGSGIFELQAGGQRIGYLDYTLPDAQTIVIEYVEVAPALRGRHFGKQLVDAAVAWARAERRVVGATCSYAMALLATRPEYQDVRRR